MHREFNVIGQSVCAGSILPHGFAGVGDRAFHAVEISGCPRGSPAVARTGNDLARHSMAGTTLHHLPSRSKPDLSANSTNFVTTKNIGRRSETTQNTSVNACGTKLGSTRGYLDTSSLCG
jgi:hypothetical protein